MAPLTQIAGTPSDSADLHIHAAVDAAPSAVATSAEIIDQLSVHNSEPITAEDLGDARQSLSVSASLIDPQESEMEASDVELVTTFYTPTVDVNQEEEIEDEVSTAALQGSFKDQDEKQESNTLPFSDIIKAFHARVPSKTYMAYGLSHKQAFTGTEALDALQKVLEEIKPGVECSRGELIEMADKLANEYWLFLPCGLQQKKARNTAIAADLEMRDTDSIITSDSFFRRKSRVQIHDDNINLYRLTKDALVLCDVSNDTFEDFVGYLKDPITGIHFKQGKLMMRKISLADCVFSRRRFEAWLQRHLRVILDGEVDSIIKLLEDRRMVLKVPLKKCYRFRLN